MSGGGGTGSSGGSGSGGSASSKGHRTSTGTSKDGKKPDAVQFNTVLRYYQRDFKTADLEATLKKIDGVTAVWLRPEAQLIVVPMTGKLEDCEKVKNAVGTKTTMLSPITFKWSLKKEVDKKPTDGLALKDFVAQQAGVYKVMDASDTSLELKIDLTLFSQAGLESTLKERGFRPWLESHERITIKYEKGPTQAKITELLLAQEGAMMYTIVHEIGEASVLVAKGDLKEDALKKAWAKLGVDVTGVVRPEKPK